MELRKYVLVEEGFQNVEQDGKVIGFQVQMRIPYYRGVPLCLVGDILVSVDGVDYTGESLRFSFGGNTYTLDEMTTVTRQYWYYGAPATVTVLKEGGLEKGVHHVGAFASMRISYMSKEELTGNYADLTME